MHHFNLIFYLFLLFFCSIGCNRPHLRRQLRDQIGSTVVLPEQIICIEEGSLIPIPKQILDSSKLIIYVDSTECGKCQIDNLFRYKEIMEFSDSIKSFNVIPLISVKKDDFDTIIYHLKFFKKPFPVFIDMTNSFHSLNPSVPDDARFHCMFVDTSDRVKFVGDPIQNERLKKVLYDLIIQ